MPPGLENFQLEMGQASQLAMSAVLFCMMFAVALGLQTKDFAFMKTAPRFYWAGVLGQVFGLPLMTLLLVNIIEPHPAIALGMLLVACCPGGNVSNLLVLLARGNTALSVSLTATSSILAAFVTPLAIIFWSSLYPPTNEMLTSIDLNTTKFLLQTAAILALPLLIGMLIARLYPTLANRIRAPLVTLSTIALGMIIAVTLVKASDYIVTIGGALIGLVALHNACAFGLGFLLASVVRADAPARRALTFELGIQNSGLGIVIIMAQFGGIGATAAIAGLWGAWHIVAGMTLVGVFRLRYSH